MKYFILSLLLFLAFQSFSQNASSSEKTQYILKVDGKEYTLEEGEELTLDSTSTFPVVSIAQPQTKMFFAGDVSFEIPYTFSTTHEEDVGIEIWTAESADVTIMVFEMFIEMEVEEMAKQMSKEFGRKNTKITTISGTFGGMKLPGRRVAASAFGETIIMDFYELDLSDKKGRFLIFEDLLDDRGRTSEAYDEIVKLVDETLVVEK